MNDPEKHAPSEPGTSEEFTESPPAGTGRRAPPPRSLDVGRETPDKEGGAPVDEMDLDGDGSRRQ